MNKLFWIVCEDGRSTLFEGRHQSRTRSSAVRYLKNTLGRSSLKGLDYSITEIPVPLIREIVAEILTSMNVHGGGGVHPRDEQSSISQPTLRSDNSSTQGPINHPCESGLQERRNPLKNNGLKVGNPGFGDDFWREVRAYWNACGSIKQTSIRFKLSQNSVKTRALREGWRKQRPDR